MVIKLKKMMQERKKHMFLSISIKTKYVLPSKNKNNQKIGMMGQRKKMMLEQYTLKNAYPFFMSKNPIETTGFHLIKETLFKSV